MDDLIVRARRVAKVGGVASSCVLLELADRVESLAADNRRLRAACEETQSSLAEGRQIMIGLLDSIDELDHRNDYAEEKDEAQAWLDGTEQAPAAAGGEGVDRAE